MSILLKEIVLDALKMPPDGEMRTAEIAAEKLGVLRKNISGAEILSASVDSRRGSPKIILTLKVDSCGIELPQTPEAEFASYTPEMPDIPENSALSAPLVIGTGPAGIYGALTLALAGCKPVIIERGSPVETRTEKYRDFLKTRQLDENSNLLIGEGGAGTFSDGKLYTGTRDRRAGWVKKIMAQCGAPPEIVWKNRAHAGSDYLQTFAANMRKQIEALGGRFIFNTEIRDLIIKDGKCLGAVTSTGEKLYAPAVLLAPGLGGRELIRRIAKYVPWELKPFQIGCRIEHPQEFIDRKMYRITPRPAVLGAAEYHIVARKYPRHVASFCMCPGGEVVNATAWQGHSISNGMSLFARDGKFANSCLIATFAPGELGTPDEIYSCIERMEKDCFRAGGGNYTLPAQDAAAFLARRQGLSRREASPATGVVAARIDDMIPAELFNALSSALKEFDSRLSGFVKYGRFIGVESCVSAPLRFIRDRETGASPVGNLFPAGEGCGAAGGIISAACDGIRCAEAMLKLP